MRGASNYSCLWGILLAAFSLSGGELTVAQRGALPYFTIVIDTRTESAKYGALELQRVIRKATGVGLAVSDSEKVPAIILGYGEAAKKAGLKMDGIKSDGFKICVADGNIYIFGDDADIGNFFYVTAYLDSRAGTYFGVLEFLERFAGARWYMPGELGEEIPDRTVAIPDNFSITINPRFSERFINTASFSGLPGIKKRLETLKKEGKFKESHYDEKNLPLLGEFGRHLRLGSTQNLEVSHAWFSWMPAQKSNSFVDKAYGKDHPEYFALRNGVRQTTYRSGTHGAQLCMSNPEAAKTYADNIIAYAKRTGKRSFSLSPNDGGEHCECADCKAMDPAGSDSITDRQSIFINKVAELVLKEVPDAKFGIYAYYESRKGPVKAKLNPAITVSDVYNNMPILYLNPKIRDMMTRDMKSWRESSNNVVLTTYYTTEGFWGFPFSSWPVLDWMVKAMNQYPSSSGIRFNFTCPGNMAPVGTSGADHYVLAKLLWDPALDAEKVANEFYSGAFGEKSGAFIRQYFDLIYRTYAANANKDVFRGGEASARYGLRDFLNGYRQIRPECATLIREAVAAAADQSEAVRWRVGRVAAAWRYMELTLDAVDSAELARKLSGAARTAAWQKAIAAGKERMAFAMDPANVFGVSAGSADYYNTYVPLGDVREMPSSESISAEAPFFKAPPVIDGKLDDAAWAGAEKLSSFKENYKFGVPEAATRVMLGRDDKGLYIAFQCAEPFMDKMVSAKDPAKIWEGDVVEFFFLPTPDPNFFVQYAINPDGLGNAISLVGDMGTDSKFAPGWKYAANRGRDRWTVELFIPWDGLLLSKAPKAGEAFYADFFRERYTGTKEFSGWAPTGAGFHTPTKYGRLNLTRNP